MKQILLFVSLLVSVFAQNCLVAVPANPLTAAGLSSLYIAQLPCNQSDPNMVSFVQGSYINTATGAVFAYNPLIVTQGTVAASTPITPVLPANVQVALWFGTNAGTLTLMDVGGSLTQGNCINGLTGSIFGQFAYCNAPAFFTAAYTAISAGQLKIPPLGTANDGQPCPTTHDFFVVDMDQSDNVITTYIDIGNSLAQDTQETELFLTERLLILKSMVLISDFVMLPLLEHLHVHHGWFLIWLIPLLVLCYQPLELLNYKHPFGKHLLLL